MRLRYVFLIAVLTFAAGMIAGAMLVGLPLLFQLMEARDELARVQAINLPTEEVPDAQVYVLIARRRIPQWSTIREPGEMFDVEASGRAGLAAHVVTLARPEMLDTLKGRRLKATVEPGHMMTEDDLLKKEVEGFDGILEKGQRAMSIPIAADRAVSFFVVPGSKVDVLHTVDGKSSVLLENVLVLAIDLNAQRVEERNGMQATATLRIDSTEDVLKLAGARDRGVLSLVMRPAGEAEKKAPGDKK